MFMRVLWITEDRFAKRGWIGDAGMASLMQFCLKARRGNGLLMMPEVVFPLEAETDLQAKTLYADIFKEWHCNSVVRSTDLLSMPIIEADSGCQKSMPQIDEPNRCPPMRLQMMP